MAKSNITNHTDPSLSIRHDFQHPDFLTNTYHPDVATNNNELYSILTPADPRIPSALH
jgi:hypothetical protein